MTSHIHKLTLSPLQMTPGELKFALLLENHLNSLPDPEYRQLVVECLMVISLVVASSPQPTFGGTLVVEHIISHARHLFLQDQVGEQHAILSLPWLLHLFHRATTMGPQWTAVVATLAAVEELPVYVSTSTTVLPAVAMGP